MRLRVLDFALPTSARLAQAVCAVNDGADPVGPRAPRESAAAALCDPVNGRGGPPNRSRPEMD
jgi:hypothetical protein